MAGGMIIWRLCFPSYDICPDDVQLSYKKWGILNDLYATFPSHHIHYQPCAGSISFPYFCPSSQTHPHSSPHAKRPLVLGLSHSLLRLLPWAQKVVFLLLHLQLFNPAQTVQQVLQTHPVPRAVTRLSFPVITMWRMLLLRLYRSTPIPLMANLLRSRAPGCQMSGKMCIWAFPLPALVRNFPQV